MILNLRKNIKKKHNKSIELVEKLIKYLDHFYKSRIEARELDATPTILAVKKKSINSWIISEKD